MMPKTCLQNGPDVVPLKARVLCALLITGCLGFGRPTFAEEYLTTELKTVTALKNVLAAQQQLLQAKQSAVQQLADGGFAPRLEHAAANQSVEFNQRQMAVCDRQIKFLQDLQDSSPKTDQVQVVIFDPSVLLKMPSRTPFVMGLDSADPQLRKQLQKAQATHKDVVSRLSRSVGFRIETLKETVQKLQASTTPSGDATVQASRYIDQDPSVEIGFLNQQLAVQEAAQELLTCRTASLRIASLPKSLTTRGISLSPLEVVALTSTYWNKGLLESRKQSILSVAKSITKFQPIEPMRTNWLPEAIRPVTADQQANILEREAQTIADVASGLQRKLDSIGRFNEGRHREETARECSELMSLFAKSTTSERQVRQLESRIAALSSIGHNDKQFEVEGKWAIIRLQVLQAEHKQDDLMVQTVLRPLYQSTSVRRHEQQNGTFDFLASFCDGQLEQSQLDQKLAARKLAEATQQAIRQLHAEGHASWLELRSAETDVLILQEEIAAAEKQLANSKLRLQILDRIQEVENNQPTVTGL